MKNRKLLETEGTWSKAKNNRIVQAKIGRMATLISITRFGLLYNYRI